jgi:hypothetical protein
MKTAISLWLALAGSLALAGTAAAAPACVVTPASSGVKLEDLGPGPLKTFHWEGACENGKAVGRGVLSWSLDEHGVGKADYFGVGVVDKKSDWKASGEFDHVVYVTKPPEMPLPSGVHGDWDWDDIVDSHPELSHDIRFDSLDKLPAAPDWAVARVAAMIKESWAPQSYPTPPELKTAP